ncbi:MAG: DUF3836 domain-containing protein [Dysgonomonas sp.]
MKARILTSVLVAVFAVSTVLAGNPKTSIFSNTEYSENGYTKECIAVDNEMRPEKKTVYEYTNSDYMLEKTIYKWDSVKGWVSLQKYTYEYNEDGELANLVYAEYDKEGEMKSAQQVELDSDNILFAGY